MCFPISFIVVFFIHMWKISNFLMSEGGTTDAIAISHSLFVSGALSLPSKSRGLDLPVNWHTCYQTRKSALTYSPPCVCLCVSDEPDYQGIR